VRDLCHPEGEPAFRAGKNWSRIVAVMGEPMRATVDDSGRLVLPEAIRDEAGIGPGMTLEIIVRDGRVEIEPAPREVRVVQRGPLWVAVPMEPTKPLTESTVELARRNLRDRRP
jgi:AbrB family looped-hinge helix DNA binding protein